MNHLAITIGAQFFGNGGTGASVFMKDDLTGISLLVSMFLRGAFALAGLILLFYFIMSGIALMGSAGKDNPKAQEQAKATLTTAVIGFVIVFTAYWIVNLIGTLLFNSPNFI